jgi:hypothetical protein
VSASQKPDATNVAGLRTWNSLGRFVKRGEKGIFILAPMIGKKRNKNEAPTDEDNKTNGESRLFGFRAVYVFDRLSRDLWRASARSIGAASATLESPLDSGKAHHRSTPLPCATLPDATVPTLDIVHLSGVLIAIADNNP